MTTHTTPTIWIAGQDQRHVNSYVERVAPFADAHELTPADAERFPGRVVHNVASRATAWLVVTDRQRWSPALSELAARCREVNAGFRCLVVADAAADATVRGIWPEDTVYLPPTALSTTVIDRLRSETHANRIASHRRRQIERLQRKSA